MAAGPFFGRPRFCGGSVTGALERHAFGKALGDPLENDVRNGSHLPDLGGRRLSGTPCRID